MTLGDAAGADVGMATALLAVTTVSEPEKSEYIIPLKAVIISDHYMKIKILIKYG